MKIARFKSHTENPFCAYHCAAQQERKRINSMTNSTEIKQYALQMIQEKDYQLAEMALAKLLDDDPNNIKLLNLMEIESVLGKPITLSHGVVAGVPIAPGSPFDN